MRTHEAGAMALDIVVDACQDRVYQLWGYDNHHAMNEKEAQEIIAAVHELYGRTLSDPWKNRRESRS